MMNKKYLYLIVIAAVVIVGAILLSQDRLPYGAGREYSSADLAGLAPVRPSETVELQDGDTYDLTAGYVRKNINGVEYRLLAYNGSIPGPLIKVVQGATITINFTNGMDMPTLLHSHGVRMDNPFDGSQATQKEMKPGETFAYTLKFPDAGMYWYHPHVREDYEQELGLYGNYLVVPADSDYWSPVNREVALFLDDILIENGSTSLATGGRIVLSKRGADHTLMGRYGNVMLVNGETDYTLPAKKGEVIRFYITNAANARPFNFAIAGMKLKLVGADGGAYEKDQWKDAVVIGPSERAVVEVLFDKEGSYALENKTPDKTYTLGTVSVSGDGVSPSYVEAFSALRINMAAEKSIDPYRRYFDKPLDKHLALAVDMMDGMMSFPGGHRMPDGTMMRGGMTGAGSDGIEWEDTNTMMGAMSTTDTVKWKIIDQDTGRENTDIDWTFKRGEQVAIRIFNDPNSMHPMQHPIHFHGQRFLVLAQNGARQDNLVWKDTVLIPSGETVDILLDASNPGDWMAHCHIAEHLESGMMFNFSVL